MKKKIVICLMVIGLMATCLCACSGGNDFEFPPLPGQPGHWGDL